MNIYTFKPVDATRREKCGVLSHIFTTSVLCLIVLFVMTTGCSTKNESSNASAQGNPEAVSSSVETEKETSSRQQLQPVKADSAVSNDARKFQAQEKEGIKVTFVELGSVNCIPCKMMQPIMKEIEREYKNQVKVVFHDVWTDDGQPYAVKYRIRVIPTQVFLDKDGKEYFRHEGFFPKEQLVEVLKKQGVK